MASRGPPVARHLLSRVGRWISGFAGGSFWPFSTRVAESPPNDPVLPDYEEEEDETNVVGLDIVDGLSAGEALRRQEGLNLAQVNARPPSPPLQLIPSPHNGMERPQQGHAPPFPAYFSPYSFPCAVPHPVPYDFPLAAPAFPADFPHAAPVFPPAFPFMDPYAFPLAAPAFPLAAPAFPAAFPAGFPPALMFMNPHAFPQAAPAFPPDFPHAAPPAAPAFPHTDPHADFDVEFERLINMYRWPEEDEDSDFSDTDDEQVVPKFNAFCPVENTGPVCLEHFSKDDESPSTPGLSSSTRRCWEEGDEDEAAAKRPRWSDESDSD